VAAALLAGCGSGSLYAPWGGGVGDAWIQEGGAATGVSAVADGPEPPLSLLWRQSVGAAPLGAALLAGPMLIQLTQETDVLAFDLASGNRLGRKRIDDRVCGAAALAGDRGQILLLSRLGADAGLYALLRESGDVAWSRAGVVCAPIAVRGRHVYAATESGRLQALTATDGMPVWEVRVEGRLLTSPAVTEEWLYFGDSKGEFLSVSVDSGRVGWRRRLDGAVGTRPAVDEGSGSLWVATATGSVHHLRADTGEPVWTSDVGGLPSVGLSHGAGVVTVGSSDQSLYAFDPASGDLRWQFDAGGIARAAPTSTSKTVYYGSAAGVLHAIDAANGESRWRYQLDGPVLTSVALSRRLLAVTTQGGTLYLFAER
jgi:outer membrane protein assembly factor BamB